MAGKPNIRSIRFSDELAQLIEQQVGNSFTEKYENLITRCVWELPQKEAELKLIQESIQKERQKLSELRKRREKLDPGNTKHPAEPGLPVEGKVSSNKELNILVRGSLGIASPFRFSARFRICSCNR